VRRAARTDGNHAEVRDGLRALGLKVFDSSALGRGFGDLVVSNGAQLLIVEVKDPAKPPSARALTPHEQAVARDFAPHYLVALRITDVLAALGLPIDPDPDPGLPSRVAGREPRS